MPELRSGTHVTKLCFVMTRREHKRCIDKVTVATIAVHGRTPRLELSEMAADLSEFDVALQNWELEINRLVGDALFYVVGDGNLVNRFVPGWQRVRRSLMRRRVASCFARISAAEILLAPLLSNASDSIVNYVSDRKRTVTRYVDTWRSGSMDWAEQTDEIRGDRDSISLLFSLAVSCRGRPGFEAACSKAMEAVLQECERSLRFGSVRVLLTLFFLDSSKLPVEVRLHGRFRQVVSRAMKATSRQASRTDFEEDAWGLIRKRLRRRRRDVGDLFGLV